MTTNKPYLFTVFSFTKGCERYFNSLYRIKNQVESCAFIFNPTGKHESVPVDHIYPIKENYQGNAYRFLLLHDLIEQDEFDLDRWVIFTDTRDVFFQADLPRFDDCYDAYVCSEGKKFQDIDFWKVRVPASFLGLMAFNVGCFAMKGYLFGALCRYFAHSLAALKQAQTTYPLNSPFGAYWSKNWWNAWADTILFNEFIATIHKVEHPTLFTCANFNLETGRAVKKNGKYRTKAGELFSIVHENGNSMEGKYDQK